MIKRQLDKAFRIYDLGHTNDNYSRATSVLVSLRKLANEEQGCSECTEMGILQVMLRAGEAIGDFPAGAGIASAFLVAAYEQ